MYEVTKSDWKLFMKKVPLWQEKYMDKIIGEYLQLLNSDIRSSAKFWELDKRIKNDKKSNGASMYMRKSYMVYDICDLIEEEIIQLEDLDDFSQGLKERVSFIINSRIVE